MMGKKKQIVLAAMLVGSLSSTAFAASSLNNADQRVREQTTQQPQAQVEAPAAQAGLGSDAVHFQLKSINVKADFKYKERAVTKITNKYIGKNISLADLDNCATELTRYFRTHGYPAAVCYAPQQRAAGGNLELAVMTGKLANVTIDNKSKLTDEIAQMIAGVLESGQEITTERLETVLYRLNDIGGIRAAGILSAGSQTGTSDLKIQIDDEKNVRVIGYVDNYGTEAAGRYQYGIVDDIYNVDHHGEHVSVTGMISNDHQKNYSASFDLPYGHTATTTGIKVSRNSYELGGQFSTIKAYGVADSISLYAKTPLLRTTNHSRYVNYGYDYRRLKDELRTVNYEPKRRSQDVYAGWEESFRGSRTATTYNLTVTQGHLQLVNDSAHLGYGQAEGNYTKGLADVTSVQGLGGRFDLLLRGQGQLASKCLDSSEQFYLGGASGIRAYAQGAASGDIGWLGSAELRYHTTVPGLMLSTYYDEGCTRGTKDGRQDSLFLKGWGLGLTYSQPNQYFFRFDYARRIGLPHANNLANDYKDKQRMWFMGGYVW